MPTYEDDGMRTRVDAEPGGMPEESDHASAGKAYFTIDGISASVDTEPLVYSFENASAAYTLVLAEGDIDSIPIQRSARDTLEDPIVGSEWRLTMETKVKDKLEADFTTVSNVCILAIDGFTLRIAI